MQPNNLYKAQRHKVSVHLITFIAAVVVAVVFAGCRNDTNKNGSTEQSLTGQSPSPSPSPSGTPKERFVPGDTIIVIRDGSVKIRVNKTLCLDDDTPGSDDKKYKCSFEIGELGIQTTGGPICVPTNITSKVTIDGGGGKEIEVKGSSGKVSIKFKKADYPDCPVGSPPGEHCGTNHVGTIKVDSPAFTKMCAPVEECEVWIKKK